MKINQIVVENTNLEEGPLLNKIGTAVGNAVGTAAKGVGAVAGGIAGLGAAAKKGYQAGKATVSAAGDDPAVGTPAPAPAGTPAPSPVGTPAPAPAPAGLTPAGKTGGSMLGSLAKGAVGVAAALGNKQAQDARAFVNTRPDGTGAATPAEPEAPGATAPTGTTPPTAGQAAAPTANATKPTMTKAQISQWISRNSEDAESLKAFLDGIGAAPAAPAQAAPAAPAAAKPATSTAPTFNAGNIMQTIPGATAKKPAAPTPNFGGPATYGKTTTTMKPMAAPAKPAVAKPAATV